MLHDASGNDGPLKMRLSTSAPRFIVQYQQLQEHIRRLQLEPPSQEIAARSHAEAQDSKYHCLNLPLRISSIAVLDQLSVLTSVTENRDHNQAHTVHSRLATPEPDALVEVRGHRKASGNDII
jgi:hypothetical protein